jgi:hypothetical protein
VVCSLCMRILYSDSLEFPGRLSVLRKFGIGSMGQSEHFDLSLLLMISCVKGV